jgi:hypothetical protein
MFYVSALDSVGEHARILQERLKAVLNESTAIGTFLLIPLGFRLSLRIDTGEEGVYVEGDRYFCGGRTFGLLRNRFIVLAGGRDLGACRSIYGSAE